MALKDFDLKSLKVSQSFQFEGSVSKINLGNDLPSLFQFVFLFVFGLYPALEQFLS